MRKMQKTKQGMASIYVVVFVTMLIGVITLSFLRIMLSESGRTEKSTLADSAMNSAMAGVEDAKTLLTKYNECIASGDSSSTCAKAKAAVTAATDDCDLGSETDKESTIGFTGKGNSGSINDQAYTCVNLTVEGDFKGKLDDSEPVLVVPMRVKDGNVDSIEGVKIGWTGTNSGSYKDYGDFNNSDIEKKDVAAVLGKKGVTTAGSEEASKANGLKVTLIQTGPTYDNGQFYSANIDSVNEDNSQTNRATLMLLPSSNGISSVSIGTMARSADKTYNAPLSVRCTADNYCSVDLHFPKPKDGNRIQDTFFLVISRVYSEPTVDEVTVKMYNNADHSGDNEVKFFNVQPIVDSTGRAGDLVRRVEVRLGSNAGQFVPLAELTVDGGLDKDFFVTKNCIKGTGSCEK